MILELSHNLVKRALEGGAPGRKQEVGWGAWRTRGREGTHRATVGPGPGVLVYTRPCSLVVGKALVLNSSKGDVGAQVVPERETWASFAVEAPGSLWPQHGCPVTS